MFEPHRYSRTRACFAEFLHAFSGADNLVLTEIYAASERPIDGISGSSLCSAIEHPCKQFVSEIDAIPAGLVRTLEPGDIVLCSGAGSIGHLPQQIVAALSELR